MRRIIFGIVLIVRSLTWARAQYLDFRVKGGWELRSFKYAWTGFVIYFVGWVPVGLWASALHKRLDQGSDAGWQVLTLTLGWGAVVPAVGITWLVLAGRKYRAAAAGTAAEAGVDRSAVDASDEQLTARDRAAMEAWAARNFTTRKS